MAAESKAALLAIIAEGKPPIEGKGAYIAELDKGLVPTSDPLYLIGMQVYGYAPAIAESKKADEPAPCIIPFEYMNDFMKDTLMAYGVLEKEAIISADVPIEADKRGIDSHSTGRRKPIYCDRMDADILYPYKEMKTISESDTTALVDGGLGLGLYIGPACMQMAIDKAKKHGGLCCRPEQHPLWYCWLLCYHGGRSGLCGLEWHQCRPSIAPTFGVEPMMGTNLYALVYLLMMASFASIVLPASTSVARLSAMLARARRHPRVCNR